MHGGAWAQLEMANVKTRYADVTRAAKREHKNAAKAASSIGSDPAAREEARLFEKFSSRAREDFRTLGRTPSAKSRA